MYEILNKDLENINKCIDIVRNLQWLPEVKTNELLEVLNVQKDYIKKLILIYSPNAEK